MADLAKKDLFLCHTGVDKDWVKGLGAGIEAEEWGGRKLSVFLDEWDIEPGENILLRLNGALETSRFVAVVMSPEMLASDWCKLEFTSVLAQDPTNRLSRLLPLLYRDVHQLTNERIRIPPILQTLAYLDFRTKKESSKSFARLVARLRGEPVARRPASMGAAFGRQAAVHLAPAVPDSRDEPDPVPEVLISNMLEVSTVPRTVWSSQTTLASKKGLPRGQQFPACTIREDRLFTFANLSNPSSPFSAFISRSAIERHAVLEWRKSPVHWRWVIELLNDTLRQYLRGQDIVYDRDSERYFFRSKSRGSRILRWGSGTLRTVVKAPPPGTRGNWVHQAAYLRFETLESRLFLIVEPAWMFTTDGIHPVSRRESGPLAMRWGGKERNGAIIRHVLAWSDVLCQGRKSARIQAGDEFVTLSRLPEVVRTTVGLADDRVGIQALMQFTRAEEELYVPEDDLYGFIEDAPAAQQKSA